MSIPIAAINQPRIVYSNSANLANRVVLYGDKGPNLLFVAGWASTEYTWRNFIPFLAERYCVHYFESREKPSAIRYTKDTDLSLETMANDLACYANTIENLKLMAGASLGATTLIQAWSQFNILPDKLALICPNLAIRLPLFYFLIRRLPSNLVKILRPYVLWGIAKFSYGADGERVAGMLRAMRAGDVDVLRQSASQLAGYHLSSQKISAINIPTLVIGTLRDEVHRLDDARQVSNAITSSKIKYLPTFGDAHSSRCARLIDEWFNEISTN